MLTKYGLETLRYLRELSDEDFEHIAPYVSWTVFAPPDVTLSLMHKSRTEAEQRVQEYDQAISVTEKDLRKYESRVAEALMKEL